MGLTLYDTPAAFLAENRDFLREQEAAAQLNLGNALSHKDESCHPGLLFGRMEEKGDPILLFGNTLPWNLCLNAAPRDSRAPKAAAELARYLRKENISISGLNAPKELCEAFLPVYGGEFRLRAAMDVLVLKQLVPPPPAPGRVRRATAADLEFLSRWGAAMELELFGSATPLEELRSKFLDLVQRRAVFLMETPDSVPVSMAYVSRALPHGAGVSGVYTPPEHRGRGYCQCTVAELCREMLSQGSDYCTLFVDQKNPISNRVYEKIGFVKQEDCRDYRLEDEATA